MLINFIEKLTPTHYAHNTLLLSEEIINAAF